MLEVDKIYNSDCLIGMLDIDTESVDMILTDCPYGIASEVNISRKRNNMKYLGGKNHKWQGKDISHDFGEWDKFNGLDDFMEFTFKWVDIAVDKLRKGGMFITYFDKDKINLLSQYLQQKYGFKIKGYYADIKSNPVPQARKVKWMNGWEIVGMWQKPEGKLTFNWQLGQHKDYGIRPIVGGNERLEHPTQKPLRVQRDFIRYWSNEGDLCMDPFMGVFTTAIACIKENRKFIGFEKDDTYYQIGAKRIQYELNQLKIFA